METAQAFAKELETKEVAVSIKSGEGGKTFGSISSKEIVEAARSQHGIEIDKKKIQMQEAIKSLGTYEITIKLHPKLPFYLLSKSRLPLSLYPAYVL